jgi:hypothetical protein
VADRSDTNLLEILGRQPGEQVHVDVVLAERSFVLLQS